jgi:DNA-binding CsgD family transcriptional regulator
MGLLMKLHVQTVKSHLAGLFNKTGTGNRLALVIELTRMMRRLRNGANQWSVVKVSPGR